MVEHGLFLSPTVSDVIVARLDGRVERCASELGIDSEFGDDVAADLLDEPDEGLDVVRRATGTGQDQAVHADVGEPPHRIDVDSPAGVTVISSLPSPAGRS